MTTCVFWIPYYVASGNFRKIFYAEPLAKTVTAFQENHMFKAFKGGFLIANFSS